MSTKVLYKTQQKLVTRLVSEVVSEVVKNLFYLHAKYTSLAPACPEPHVFARVPTSVGLGSKYRTLYLDVLQNIGLSWGQVGQLPSDNFNIKITLTPLLIITCVEFPRMYCTSSHLCLLKPLTSCLTCHARVM